MDNKNRGGAGDVCSLSLAMFALRAMFVRFAHDVCAPRDVCSLRSRYLFASLTMLMYKI